MDYSNEFSRTPFNSNILSNGVTMKKLLFVLLTVLSFNAIADSEPIIEGEVAKVQEFFQDPEEYGKIESNKYFIRICIEGIQYVSWYSGNSSWTPLVNKYGKPLRCKIIEKKTN